jgi:predicted GNAT superfamily acetyltransferase
MTSGEPEIGLANLDDVAGILALQERNLRQNGGALSVRLPREWFAAAIEAMPVMVARRSGTIVGYVVSSPREAQGDDPILNAMLVTYPGSPNAYVYGPICVDASERGRGLARALIDALRAKLPGREGFTFIRADNAVSREVHARMGMHEAATFTVAGIDYVVVAYVG